MATGSIRIGSSKQKQERCGAKLVAVTVLSLALSGCGIKSHEDAQVYDVEQASEVFAIGYEDIAEIYIESLEVSDLALAGLDGVEEIEPGFDVIHGEEFLIVTMNGQEIGRYARPARADTDAWGDVTALAIESGRTRSGRLGSAQSEEIYEAVFDGLIEELDGFSRYAGREQARENRASRDGFGGIGVRIQMIEEGVKVVSVMERTPAERAGLQDNDVIVDIDGVSAAEITQEEAVRLLRGPIRSKVNVIVTREAAPGGLPVTLVRAHIVPQTVRYHREGNVAYMRVAGFNQDTTQTLRQRMLQAEREIGDDLVGFVLDLRGNPGGLLDQSVAVSDLFVTGGRIVSTHGRHPDSHQFFNAEDDDLARGLPIVVLVNGGSASASEIVAAALQDANRAIVVGSNSYGKGTVQTVLRLPNEGELTLTWARFHAPSGYTLQSRGVLPNVCTAEFEDSDELVVERVRRGEGLIDRRTRVRPLDINNETSLNEHRANCPLREDRRDLDLEIALSLLRDRALYARILLGSEDTAQRSQN